ncbi:MAG: hypothetical protein J4F34_05640 [Gemmatimonadetes bacterium]|nr:hypothetical protein [Gemmatimonadota bacterium]
MRALAGSLWGGCPGAARPAAGAALALVAALGCDLPHPASPDPYWVGIASLLEVGEREAYILARYQAWHVSEFDPRLGREPAIAVSLEGPGWTVPLADTVVQRNCGLLGVFNFLDAKGDVCLRGTLPEAIRSGVEYRLSGVTEHGPFTGRTVAPQPTVLLEPESDTVLFRAIDMWVPNSGLWVPVRYRFGSDVGTRIGEMGGTVTPFRTTILVGAESGRVRFDPDTMVRSPDPVAVPVPMRLAGVGRNYTRFLENTVPLRNDVDHFLVLRPWPETGIEGEGVYGYFDGVSFSRTVTVVVEFPGVEEDEPGS